MFADDKDRLELAGAGIRQVGPAMAAPYADGSYGAGMRPGLRSRRIGMIHLPNRSASSSCR